MLKILEFVFLTSCTGVVGCIGFYLITLLLLAIKEIWEVL